MVVGVKKSIYPQNSMSINALYAEYVRIAVEKYHAEKQAKLKFETRVETDASLQELKQNSIVSIVFSAMCIESFLNEYASACIGDSEFYGSFDTLSPEGKLMLISRFLFGMNLDKSQALYSCFKRLFKDRNQLVHNKSIHYDFESYYAEHPAFPMPVSENMIPNESEAEWDCEYIIEQQNTLKLLHGAKNGIQAIIEVARYFDANDVNANAIISLFYPATPSSVFDTDSPYNNTLRVFQISKYIPTNGS